MAQEALTNVRKHAPGARVLVRLEYLPDEVALEVSDSGGRRPEGELSGSGSGYGLLGMRERAELMGGTLEAGPGSLEGLIPLVQGIPPIRSRRGRGITPRIARKGRDSSQRLGRHRWTIERQTLKLLPALLRGRAGPTAQRAVRRTRPGNP
ncbi:Histidine kinase-, DNA gyrase B-, and HSP90-like ATPase [Streptomyces atratus]|uniref:histidine kinase n=1 Tax=Streptomyces atratus TaxID=1893 RepID=A0A1K2EX76_STRAR|nr:Histidine kinase-, DNA gyrase B-, and HSP90-like ATPase [Streptomyces atratus]